MVDFIKKRLQVFISSTYTDLIPERQAAVEAVLVSGHIPAGMELFSASNETQMTVIKEWIDESDVYLLILGSRYGSIEPKSGKSYTEIEYDYAVEAGKELFSVVIDDGAIENRIKDLGSIAIEQNRPDLLREFRKKATSNVVKFWMDSKDIKLAIAQVLSNLSRREDLVGWVKADPSVNIGKLAAEIGRLSSENADLRTKLLERSKEPLEVSLSDLIELLEIENLLEKFITLTGNIHENPFIQTEDESDCKRLNVLGLLTIHNFKLSLTSTGTMVRNKLLLTEHKNKKNSIAY